MGGFEYSKVRALLAYLAVESAQPHTRAHLCALLWPNSEERAARQNLSQALSKLRRALSDTDASPPFLLITPEAIQLNPDAGAEVDVGRFEALILAAEAHARAHRGWHVCTPCAGRLRQATDLYRGDFLAQFGLRDGVPFEEWAVVRRERLRQRMLSALERLARYAEWRGAYEQAADDTRRAADLEPWLETTQRALMRRLALGGQTAAALAQFEHLRKMLADDLRALPEAETIGLYEQIRAETLVPPQPVGRAARLPQPPTRLIGREQEQQAALALLWDGQARALTLTGPPGIGKTRLALALAHALQFDFEDGASFVDLAPVAAAALVPAALARALEVVELAGESLAARVITALRRRHLLLVLDNFEHVVEAAGFAAELLAACPGVALLVTSRRPLGIRAEQQLPVPPLAWPAPDASVEAVAAAPAVRLLVERLQAARPDFGVTPEQAPVLASLCARLDGLPLAIELIAARGKTLPPADLLRELEQGLQALTEGLPDLPARQRSLRAAIAWSYDRLSPAEQRVFARLGVFAGGCTLEAAQAVAGAEGSVLPALEALHSSSLVQTQAAGSETRFRLLETLREFALDQLAGLGEIEMTRRRHLDYCLALAERAQPALEGPEPGEWLAQLERDHENLRAALALAHALDEEAELRLAVALGQFWESRGYFSEGRRWLAQALAAHPQAALPLQGAALMSAGQLARFQGDYSEARQLFERALRLWQQLEDGPAILQALRRLGSVAYYQGDLSQAQAYDGHSLAMAREAGDTRSIAWVLNSLGLIAADQGDYALAQAHFQACLPIFRELGEPLGEGLTLNNLGLASFNQVDYAAARSWLEAGLATLRAIGHKWGAALALLNLGNVALAEANLAQARAYNSECLALCQETGDRATASYPLFGLGQVAYLEGDTPLAGSLYRQSLGLRAEAGERGPIPRNLEGLGQLERVAARPERAARLFGAAEALRERLGKPISPRYRVEYEVEVAALRAALDQAAFQRAWAAGRELDLEAAVAEALESA